MDSDIWTTNLVATNRIIVDKLKLKFSTLLFTKDDGSLVIDLSRKNTIYIIIEVEFDLASCPTIETIIVIYIYN